MILPSPLLEERALQQIRHVDRLLVSKDAWSKELPRLSSQVKEWLQRGVSLPRWRAGRPQVHSMLQKRAKALVLRARQASWSADDRQWAVEEVARLEKEKLVKEVPLEQAARLLPVFMVSTPKRRLILDARHSNKLFVAPPRFRLDGLKTVEKLVQRGDSMVKTDVESAYHLVRLAPETRPWFCFVLGDRILQWQVLPLGWSWAPWIWTQLLKPVVEELRVRFKWRASAYLDDLWAALDPALSAEEKKRQVDEVRRLLAQLGIPTHPKKSVWTPTTTMEVLGWRVDTRRMELSVPTDKAKRVLRELRVLSRSSRVQVSAWASTLGRFRALRDALRLALLSTRAWTAEVAKAAACVGWRRCWAPSTRARLEVEEAIKLLESRDRSQLKRPFGLAGASHILTTDASSWGWGATLHLVRTDSTTAKVLQRRRKTAPAPHCIKANAATEVLLDQLAMAPVASAQGRWPLDLARRHCNGLEARAVPLAMRAMAKYLHVGSRVLVATDNSTVAAALNRWTTRSNETALAVTDALEMARRRRWWIGATHVPGRLNLEADSLSRRWSPSRQKEEWPIGTAWPPALLRWACMPAEVQVDLFAAAYNKINRARHFVTRLPETGALCTDAFSIPWTPFKTAWINPPFCRMGEVVARLSSGDRPGRALVIAPHWPRAVWWNQLLALADKMVILPPSAVGCGPGTQLAEPFANPHWTLVAFAL